MTALGTAAVAVYLSRSNRALLRATAEKTGAETEGTRIETAVLFIQEVQKDRQTLWTRLEEAEKKEAATRAEREALYKERSDLRKEIELRDGQIRFLARMLRDAGVELPADLKPYVTGESGVVSTYRPPTEKS